MRLTRFVFYTTLLTFPFSSMGQTPAPPTLPPAISANPQTSAHPRFDAGIASEMINDNRTAREDAKFDPFERPGALIEDQTHSQIGTVSRGRPAPKAAGKVNRMPNKNR